MRQCDVVMGTLHNTPFTDMNDAEGPTQAAGYIAFDTASRLLPLLTEFIGAVRIREDRVRATIDAACLGMTELADSLVREEGLSFRQAHEVAAALSRQLIEAGKGISALTDAQFAEAFAEVAGRAPGLSPAELRRLTSPEHFLAVRALPGGPGALDASLEAYRATLADRRARLGGLDAAEAAAAAELDRAVARLTDRS